MVYVRGMYAGYLERSVCELKNPLNLVKVKRVKVTERDIRENLLRIQMAKEKVPVGSDEWERLSEEEEKENVILKKFKEAHQFMAPKDAFVIIGSGLLCFFVIALNREWPSAVKIASTVLKWIPFKG